jgi:hypothetical protein
MAKRVTESLVDDLDGSEAAETLRFSIDGADYEIDLSENNASEFHDAFAPYISAARRVGGRQGRGGGRGGSRGSSGSNGSSPDPKQVREWAKSQGLDVNPRGRVPKSLIEQYQAAQG